MVRVLTGYHFPPYRYCQPPPRLRTVSRNWSMLSTSLEVCIQPAVRSKPW